MRDLIRQFWPWMLAAVLLVVLVVLTLMTQRARRGSRLYRARVAVLAMLVALTTGAGLPGCESEGGGQVKSGGKDAKEIEPSCYAADASVDVNLDIPKKDAGEPDIWVECYVAPPPDAEDEETVQPPDPDVVMCYAAPAPDEQETIQPPPDATDAGQAELDEEEIIMCYDPAPPDIWEEPEVTPPEDAGPTDAGAAIDPDDEGLMCYFVGPPAEDTEG